MGQPQLVLQLHGMLQAHQQLQLQLSMGSSDSASSPPTTSWISKVSASSWRSSIDRATMAGSFRSGLSQLQLVMQLQLHGAPELQYALQLVLTQLSTGSDSASSPSTTSWISKVSASSPRSSVDRCTTAGFPFPWWVSGPPVDGPDTSVRYASGRGAAAAGAATAGARRAAAAAAGAASLAGFLGQRQFRLRDVVDLERLRLELAQFHR
jgi:hypothetical protein